MKNASNFDREGWLTEAAALIMADIIHPSMPYGYTIDHDYRVSVGYPPRSRGTSKTRVLGFCTIKEASADSHNEIFITPEVDDSAQILATLTHELIHHADNCASGHRGFFRATALKAGLLPPMTSTTPSEAMTEYFDDLIKILGDIPHAKLTISKARKKQSTRMIKVVCSDPACGFTFRTSRKQIDTAHGTYGTLNCPSCLADAIESDV